MAESMRDRVLKEIISTEETYLRQLDILEKFFEKPCIEKCLLPTNVHTSIFGELSTLRRMNEELYKELTAEDSNVGQAFLHLAPFLKAYSSYANSYQTSLNLLQEWIVRSPELKVWLGGTETRPEVQTKLPSLLITPVQRVPRYRLLLEELRRYTPEDHPHYSDIIGALEEISRVAEHINKCVREGECVQRMLLLQKAFKYGQPNIIAPGRTLLKEGRLHKVSRKGSGSHERLFFLFSDMLVYTKIPSSSSMTTSNSLQMGHVVEYKAGSLQCCCVLPLKHCTVTPIFGSSNQCKTFRICCESENLVLYSSDADEGNSWLLAIEEAIARLAAKRRTLRKESSSKKPMRRPALRKFTLKGNPNELQVLKATTQTVDSPKTPKFTPPPLPPPPPPPPSSSSVKTVTSPQPTKPPQTSKSPFARAKECFASPKMRLTATSKKKKSKRKHEDVEVSENDEGGFERPKVKLKSLNSHIPTSPQRKWDPRDREQCLLDQFKRPKTVLLPCHLPSVSDGASFPTSPARQLTLQPPNSSVSTNTARLVSSEERGSLYGSLSPRKYPSYQTFYNPSEKVYIQKPLSPSNKPLPTGSFAPNKGFVPDRRIPYYIPVSPGKGFPQYESPSPSKGFPYGSVSPVRSPPYSSVSPRAPYSVSPSHGRFSDNSLSPTRSISSHSSASLGGNTPPYNLNLYVRDRYSSVSPVRDRSANTSLSPSVHGQMNNSTYSLSSSNPNTSISPVRGRQMNTSINSIRGELNNSRSPQGRYMDTSLSPVRRGQGNISDVHMRGRRMNTLRSPVNRQSRISQSPDRISFCSNSPTRTTSYSGSPVRGTPKHTSVSPARSVSWYSSTSPARSLPSHSSGSPARSVASYSSTSPARSVSSYSSTSPARTFSSHSSGSPVRSIASYSSTSPARSVSIQSSSPVRPRSSCTSAVPTRSVSMQSSNSGQYYVIHRSRASRRSPQLCKSISPSRRPTSFGLISPVKTIVNSSRTSPAHGRAATHWDLNTESSKRPLSPGKNLSPNLSVSYGSNSNSSVSRLGSSPSHSSGTSRSDFANTSSGSIESSSSHKNVRRIMSLEYIRQHPALDTEV